DILLNHFEWSTTNSGDKVCVRPQGRESRFEPGILLAQQPRGTPLDGTHQTMNAVLRVHFHEEMHVLWHDVQFQTLGIRFSAYPLDNLFKTVVKTVDQHGTAVLRTPDNVIFAGVDHVVI